MVGDLMYVGFAPAAIVCIDFNTGRMVDVFQYSSDIQVCVHGLRAAIPMEARS